MWYTRVMKFNRRILPNGIRVITVPMADHPTVTVLVAVEAGSNNESTEQNGISHFLEHMCFKGTLKRPTSLAISREFDRIGAENNAYTSHENTAFYAKSDRRHVSLILEIIADIYQNSTLPEIELEKEKGVIIDEMRSYEDMPSRDIHDVLAKLLYGKQPAGRPIIGTTSTLGVLTRNDLVAYREKFYRTEGTVVVVAGGFDESKIFEEIIQHFGTVERKSGREKIAPPELSAERVALKKKSTDQAHIALALPAFPVFHPLARALKVVMTILGGGMSSRLFQKIREEMGLGYYVYATADLYMSHGYGLIGTGVDPKRVREVIEVILGEMKKIVREGISQGEFDMAKDHLTGALFLELETSDAVAEFFVNQELKSLPLETPNERAEKYKKLSQNDIREAAEILFSPEKIRLALIGPFENTGEFQPLLDSATVGVS
ncbi:MAG: hypothetical protein A2928_01905 [Candidatus Taylorbacteria bacterium RIFCSPLOWO2_01_FULL_45_15b]|uniref:Peptidase M16 n=1 Tax=Candidatus Taylorbacteria bacterium RIFCSPLOWO2_01_FULL_45_15b TaxID=1802319 RepID=A0A1G2N925_9BACT|nr:MAG: hypothetical protein A2928_01905 [Candidatus Taylorbacteria bacterium RIFCSPLOWO2_01_FULL_45_15b]